MGRSRQVQEPATLHQFQAGSISLLDGDAAGGPTSATYNYTFAPSVRGVSTTTVTTSFSNGSTDSTNNSQAFTFTR